MQSSSPVIRWKLDIHLMSKQPMGERLALLSLGKVYGQDILCEAPEFEKAELTERKLTLTFKNTGNGIYLTESTVNTLEIHVEGEKITDFSYDTDGANLPAKPYLWNN